ncbi:transcriptional regulator with XRE-family HTH domain [Rhizobium skierniewicense]|uniref:Transcriptional regulator with XRE-family HTH domain n=1 Tax=Rhizobium skierniewicense TaxID=984260 RepID=A0A7W6G332_9HYPH|nr:helix-turn-helix transcriptional regulator [Rhizobium skierniewicense]MBB3947089.1 transcriptional regulator with XRE-family HTH domain [Rhizobium skierniewicense]
MLDTAQHAKKPNPVDIHVGAKIRARRAVVGMSQEKLGDALGITFQQVQKYEKGTNRVGASRLHRIAEVLSVPPSYFFDGSPSHGVTENDGKQDDLTTFMQRPDGIRLAKLWLRVGDSEARRKLLGVVELVANSSCSGDN